MTSRTIITSTFALLPLAAALTFSQSASAADYKQIKSLGNSTSICKPAINSGAELQSFFANQSDDVMAILNDAQWDGSAQDLFDAVAQGNFSERAYPVGTRLHWMGMRKPSGIEAGRNREWAGEVAFEGYEVNVVSNCKVHQIVIPKACCNVSLASISDVVVQAPVVNVSQEGETGENVKVTVNAPSGQATVAEITNPDGSTMVLPLVNGMWAGQLEPGDYMVTARAEDDCGSASGRQMLTVLAPETAGYYIAPFVGRQVREIDPPLVGVQVGKVFPITERTGVFVQGGVSYNIKDEETSLFIDTGLERKIGEEGFIGVGVGQWDINRSEFEDTTYFVHGGGGTPWTIGGDDVQWFTEARVFDNHTDDITHHNVIKAGLRIEK